MKNSLLMVAARMLFAGSAFAQATVPAAATSHPKAAPAAATVHVMCKDGTPFDGTTRSGACSGHHGIDKNATAAMDAAPMKSAPLAVAPTKTAPLAMQQAAGGGAGKVWVNTASKV